MAANTIPQPLYRQIQDWLKPGRSGRIVLHVGDGRIQSYELTETGKVADCNVDKTSRP